MIPKFEVVPITSLPEARDHRPVVLVVDDEVLIADTLATILSQHGFAAFSAYEARSALEFAETTPPDVLLSDVAMPGMTGIDLAIAISAKFVNCRILLFSGQAHTSNLLSEACAAGYDFPVLTKPIHPRLLLEYISNCLEDSSPVNDTGITGEFALSGEGQGPAIKESGHRS